MKQVLADATVLTAPNTERLFDLDTDAIAVAIAIMLHQEQEHNGKLILRPVAYDSKQLTLTQLNYGALYWKCTLNFVYSKKFIHTL